MRLSTIVAAVVLTSGLGTTSIASAADAAIASAFGYPVSHYLSNQGLPAGVSATQPRVLLLGDSTMASLAWNPPSQATLERLQPNVTLDAKSCRAISLPSCVGRTDPITGIRSAAPNALDVLGATATGSYDEIVMMIGYDEGWDAFQSSVPAFLQLAREKGISHVTWLTFHSNGNYAPPSGMGDASYRSNNILLQQNADASNGYLTLLDWSTYADEPGHDGWIEPDGAHLTAAGSFALGDFMTDAVLDIWQTVLSAPAADIAHPQQAAGPAGGFTFLPDPVRVVDTRDGTGLAHSGLVASGQSLRVQLPATSGLVGATVNVTIVDPTVAGFMTIYPCTATVPVASNSNFLAGEARAATATVAVDADGGFCIYSSSWTRLAVDEMAVVTAGSGAPSARVSPSAIAPVRVLDTRSGMNGTRLAAKTPREVPLAAFHLAGSALSVNATLVATGENYVTVYPTDGDDLCPYPPGTSTVNSSQPVSAVPNRVDVPVRATAKLCVFSPIATDLVLDVTATFATGSTYRASSPTRLVDTRASVGGNRGTQWKVNVPSGQIASLVVTSVGSAANSFLTVYPSDTKQQCGRPPVVSTVNVEAGSARANSIFAAASTATVCISSNAATDLVVDLQGTA